MRKSVISVIVLSLLLNFGCVVAGSDPAGQSENRVESVYTSLGYKDCEKRVDQDDPNELIYHLCPGVSNFSLIVRRVGSGRTSIDIRTPHQDTYPLDFQDFITPHIMQLGGRAEWRISIQKGQRVPIALIVPVNAHENIEEPEEVTHSYLAIAKITSTEICVTERIINSSVTENDVHRSADSARSKRCLKPQPR